MTRIVHQNYCMDLLFCEIPWLYLNYYGLISWIQVNISTRITHINRCIRYIRGWQQLLRGLLLGQGNASECATNRRNNRLPLYFYDVFISIRFTQQLYYNFKTGGVYLWRIWTKHLYIPVFRVFFSVGLQDPNMHIDTSPQIHMTI